VNISDDWSIVQPVIDASAGAQSATYSADKYRYQQMCGFVAMFQKAPRIGKDAARRCLDTIAHRGPDASGEWCDDHAFLGHRRLSIIDLSTGAQPMHSADGRYVVVFNGEIYNFLELRDVLSREGSVFRTQSDTEVILEGYRCWGASVVERLNGMFGFVIWDRVRATVFCARDRLGIKPLNWAMHEGALIVTSTLEPFSALNGFNRVDMVAVRDLMVFDYIPAPRTIFERVNKLEPGSALEWTVGADRPSVRPYWQPPQADKRSPVPDESELEHLLDRAVKRQMISDVPIGAFLSGGIDSSLLVAMMARHSDKPVQTFSVQFSEGGVDESPIAELVARQYGTDHTVLPAEEFGADALLELFARLDEPFCDPTLIPTYGLSLLTRRHVKVALSGDGGDEVFGGYPKYLLGADGFRPLPFGSFVQSSLRALPWRPRGIGRVFGRLLSPQDRIRWEWSRYGDFPVFRKDMRQLLLPDYWNVMKIEDYFEPWERQALRYGEQFDVDVLMRADLGTYLSENCLVKTDRASMLASLEVRVPYLDETIIDRILPLPASQKIASGSLKALLRPIARRLLPREAWDRPKHGFTVPLEVRLAGAWRPAVEAMLDWGEPNFGLFDYRYLRRLAAISGAGGAIGRDLWNPFVLLAWAKAHSLSI
jgi:asparagine synthase (glutamine-hydrolysing)